MTNKNNNNNDNNKEVEKPLGEMTKEERTNYSIKRAPDYPGKEENVLTVTREKCWNSRDIYFKCLDENNDDESKCKLFFNEFNNSCLKSWVSNQQTYNTPTTQQHIYINATSTTE